MIKKLTKKIEIAKRFNLIKKHYQIAKRHKSCDELENVTSELIDFQNNLLEENVLSEFMALEIHCLFEDISYFKLKLTQIDLARVGYYS